MAGGGPQRRGIWQAEVLSRVGELAGRARVVESEIPPGNAAPKKKAVVETVEELLATARKAADGGWVWTRVKHWWTGSAITEAWEAVHNAELALTEVESEAAVRSTLPRMLAWVKDAVESPERRGLHTEFLTAQIKGPKSPGGAPGPGQKAEDFELTRTRVRGALADVISANRSRYANLRLFRNTLILATALLALLAAGVATWHALNTSILTLCPEGAEACVPGPAKFSVAQVGLLGAIGGALALTLGLAQTESIPSRYDPKSWQAFLKPATGAVTGILGVMLIQSELVLAPTGNKEYFLLIYAVIFGFSQQLFTRTVDKRADELVKPATKTSPDPKADG